MINRTGTKGWRAAAVAMLLGLGLPPHGYAQNQFVFFGNTAAIEGVFSTTSFNNSTDPIPVEFIDEPGFANDIQRRALIGFGSFAFGAPVGQVFVGADLQYSTISAVPGSALAFNVYSGDLFPSFSEGFGGDDALAARVTPPSGPQTQTIALDPGEIAPLLDAGSNVSLEVLAPFGGSSVQFDGGNFGTPPGPTLTLLYLDPSNGTQWLGGNGSWNSSFNWTAGAPFTNSDAFIMPAVNSVVQAPSSFTTVGTLTLGGGGGDATLQTVDGQQFNVTEQTTLLDGGRLNLTPRAFVTGGLRIESGATIDWGDEGVLSVDDGFLSTPIGADFVVDATGSSPLGPLLIVNGDAKFYQSDLDTRTVVGQDGAATLLVAGNAEVRLRDLVLGEQATGRGRLDVQNPGALLWARRLSVGEPGAGEVQVSNGGRIEAPVVALGGFSSDADPTTQSTLDVEGGGTLETVIMNINGNAQVTVAERFSTESARHDGSSVSLFGRIGEPVPTYTVGRNGEAVLTDRLNLGLAPPGEDEGTGKVVVEDGGFLSSPLLLASLGLSNSTTGDTELVVRDAGSRLEIGETLFGGVFGGAFSAEVRDGGAVSVQENSSLGSAGPQASAEVLITGGGTWTQVGELQVAGIFDPDFDPNPADGGTATFTIEGDGSRLQVDSTLRMFRDATVVLEGGELRAATIANERGGDFVFTDGRLDVDRYEGDLNQQGGTLLLDGSEVFTGAFTLTDGAVEFTSPLDDPSGFAAASFGSAALGGELIITGPASAELGDVFTLLTTDPGGLTGEFDTMTLPAAGAGLGFAISYTPEAVLLEVVVADALLGDYDGDGFVSQADLNLVLLNWGQSTLPDEWVALDQFDGGLIGQNELNGVLLNWGNGTPPGSGVAAVPEPATAGLILALGGALGRRRR